jgi:glycosyltransferase involved in cell wall biosynthesis
MSHPTRLAILATHPVQYQAPWFARLAREPDLELTVYYGHRPTAEEHGAAGFGVAFQWDRPLLEGYRAVFLRNAARHPSLTRFSGVDLPEAAAVFSRDAFDAVLVMGWHFLGAWQAFRACWRSGLPVLVRGDSHLHTKRSALKRLVKRVLHRRFVPRFAACLAVGEWSREYFLHYGAAPERVFIVPHAVDTSALGDAGAAARAAFRGRWQLSEERCLVLFSGKLLPVKRPLDFVSAVAAASRREGSIAGLVVGDGPLRAACELEAQRAGAPIHFAGFLNQGEMGAAYAAADLLVLPGEETWGLVVNEAMSCGRPCLVSDAAGCGPELIVPGETGGLFPCGNVPALAAQLVAAAREPAGLRRMGQRARQHLAPRSWDATLPGLRQALAAALR